MRHQPHKSILRGGFKQFTKKPRYAHQQLIRAFSARGRRRRRISLSKAVVKGWLHAPLNLVGDPSVEYWNKTNNKTYIVGTGWSAKNNPLSLRLLRSNVIVENRRKKKRTEPKRSDQDEIKAWHGHERTPIGCICTQTAKAHHHTNGEPAMPHTRGLRARKTGALAPSPSGENKAFFKGTPSIRLHIYQKTN